MLNDVLRRASALQQLLPREIMAHRVSAEYHRHRHMKVGGLATIFTTLIGSSVFTALLGQFGLEGKVLKLVGNPFSGLGGTIVYFTVLILSIAAPVLAALNTFMHDSEDVASHAASVQGYAEVLSRLTVFLAKYIDTSPAGATMDEALKEYDEIMNKYNSVLGNITLTERAYKKADKLIKEQESAPKP